MATTVGYTPAQKKSLKVFEWSTRTKSHATRRAIKMVRPVCAVCYRDDMLIDASFGWWEKCEHHPYERLVPKHIKTEVFKTDDDGDIVLDEEATKASTKTKMILVPNIVEVVWGKVWTSANQPLYMQSVKGFKTLPQAGYAPMCEALGCGRPWPTVQVTKDKAYKGGLFCSEEHAISCEANRLGLPTFVGSSGDVTEEEMESASQDMENVRPKI